MDTDEPTRKAAAARKLLTIPEALQELRIGRSSFYKLAARGEIRTLRLGGRTLVPAVEIDRLITKALGNSGAA